MQGSRAAAAAAAAAPPAAAAHLLGCFDEPDAAVRLAQAREDVVRQGQVLRPRQLQLRPRVPPRLLALLQRPQGLLLLLGALRAAAHALQRAAAAAQRAAALRRLLRPRPAAGAAAADGDGAVLLSYRRLPRRLHCCLDL
jgi:hypothetical protein